MAGLTAEQIYILNRMNTTASKVALGQKVSDALDQVALAEAAAADAVAAQAAAEAAETAVAASVSSLKKLTVKAQYSFDALGGAVGDIGLGVTIPDNAVVTDTKIDVLTAPDSAGSLATVAVKVQAAADLLAATAVASVTGILQGKPTNGDVTKVIKLTAAREVKITVAVEDLTVGIFNVFVEYLVSD